MSKAATRALASADAVAARAAALAAADRTLLDALILQQSDAICADLGVPADDEGIRTLARESYRETVFLEKRARLLVLSRVPASIIALSVDDVAEDVAQLHVDARTGEVRLSDGAYFCAGATIIVDYLAGWWTAPQIALSTEDPPPEKTLPEPIEAALDLAVLQAYSFSVREEFAVESTTETVEDMGTITQRYASLARSGASLPDKARNLLAPFRRLW